jgi:hypothetical protein
MPIETVSRLCTPNAVVTSDSPVEQVAQIEDLARGSIDGREFFRRNYFTDGLQRLVERGFERLAGRSDDGAFYLTQAMGGGKTHSLIAFGLLAEDPELRREVVPRIRAGAEFDTAKVVIFNGHQNPENLLWGFIGERLGQGEVMAPFWRNGARTPGVDEWVAALGDEPVLILLDELPSYLQMAQGEPAEIAEHGPAVFHRHLPGQDIFGIVAALWLLRRDRDNRADLVGAHDGVTQAAHIGLGRRRFVPATAAQMLVDEVAAVNFRASHHAGIARARVVGTKSGKPIGRAKVDRTRLKVLEVLFLAQVSPDSIVPW